VGDEPSGRRIAGPGGRRRSRRATASHSLSRHPHSCPEMTRSGALHTTSTALGSSPSRAAVIDAEAAGVEHPGLIGTDDIEILTGQSVATPLHEVYGYDPAWGYPSEADRKTIVALMARTAPQGGSAPAS
jgi:hypothetical protein